MRHLEVSSRIALFVALFVLVTGVLVGRLFYLQVLAQEAFLYESVSQRFRSVREEAPRGEILDRNGAKLASYRIAYRINLLYPTYLIQQPRTAPQPNLDLLQRLANVLEMDPEILIKRTLEKIEKKLFFEPLFIKDDVTVPQLSLLLERRVEYPGVHAVPYPIRNYPFGPLAAHLIGYVGQIDPVELERLAAQGYRGGDVIGKMGLEMYYDPIIRGTSGRTEIEIDGNYRPTGIETQREERQQGKSIQLTIDKDLQQMAQFSLERSLTYISTERGKAEQITNANAGAVVVMDVHTGAILAMASHPTFDPNMFVDDPKTAVALLSDSELAPLWNRAISGAYQPGSTWKMLTSFAALDAGAVAGPHETVFCSGVYTKVEPKRDWLPQGHGAVNLEAALAHSCDIYYYEMGYRLGPEKLSEMAATFGFGGQTGIDLPGEAAGWIPDKQRLAERAAAGEPWTDGKSLSTGIGQILTTTPLQLARYTAMIANGGARIRPHLVSAIIDQDGNVEDVTPAPDGRVSVEPAYFTYVQQGMAAVTEWGTSAGSFKGFPFRVAGKTGTAEVFGQDDYGVYVAYAPADKPEIAVAIVGERAGKGEWMNPVAKAVFAAYFKVTPPKNDSLYLYGILTPPPEPEPPVGGQQAPQGRQQASQQPVPPQQPPAQQGPAEPPAGGQQGSGEPQPAPPPPAPGGG